MLNDNRNLGVLRNVSGSGVEAMSTRIDKWAFAGGMAWALPAGIVRTENPFTQHDYTVTDPMNMKAVDDLLLGLVVAQRQRMANDGVLYVVTGEIHNRSSHKMAQAGLLENLALLHQNTQSASYRPSLMDEKPYNKLAWYARYMYGLPVNDNQYYSLHTYDPLGVQFAWAALGDNCFVHAPQSINRNLETVLRYNIPMAFVDTAYKNDGHYIDDRDPIAREVAQEKFQIDLSKENISPISSSGMEIRNAVMARRSIEGYGVISESNQSVPPSGIKIITTGLNHLGNKEKNLSFETSLQGHLVKLVNPQDLILTVFNEAAGFTPEKTIPLGKYCQITPIVVRGLSDEWYIRGESKQEIAFIRKLGGSYGYDPEGIPSRFRPQPKPSLSRMEKELRSFLSLHPCTP